MNKQLLVTINELLTFKQVLVKYHLNSGVKSKEHNAILLITAIDYRLSSLVGYTDTDYQNNF
jgi:hypothetical protein